MQEKIQQYTEKDIYRILEETGSYLNGHFLLSSGLHSDTYIQCAKVLKYPRYAELFGKLISSQVNSKIDYVVSPAMGGIIIGYEVAKSLNAVFLFTERNENGEMTLRREQNIEKDKNILIVEDVITTGKSTLEVANVVKKFGGEILGISCIVNRSQKEDLFGKKIISLIKVQANVYPPEDCPLCEKGYEIVKPGSRKKLL